jgi:hypothetical protein
MEFRMLEQSLQAIEKIEDTTIEEIIKTVRPNVHQFARLFALGGNQTKASVLAGFVGHYGGKLMHDPRVQALVAHYRAVYAEQAGMTQERLVQLWANQAGFSPAVLLRDDWTLRQLDELTHDQREQLRDALLGIEVVEKQGSRTIKPKFDRQKAQEQLGKLFGMYEGESKGQGEGLTLNINVGQQLTVGGASEDTEVGHLRVRLPADAPEED